MADNPPLTENGRTNLLDVPKTLYAELQTQAAFAKFNSAAKRRPNERRDDRDDDGRR